MIVPENQRGGQCQDKKYRLIFRSKKQQTPWEQHHGAGDGGMRNLKWRLQLTFPEFTFWIPRVEKVCFYNILRIIFQIWLFHISNGKMWPRACQVSTDHLMSPVLYVLGHGFLFMNRESRKMNSRDFVNHVPMWVVGLLGSFKSEHLGDSFAFPTSYTT